MSADPSMPHDSDAMPLEHGCEQAGDVLGAYRLVEKLGEGGFGVVWRAEQTQPVQREVALKLLKRGMDTQQVLARFEQERRVLAAMEHPCIATMLDAGVSPDGRPFFVMELLRGLPITTYCERHTLPLREKIALFRDVCGGVQHAHQKGVIHRDLKPTNILVMEVDGKPVPKIIDFGIAKALATGGIRAMTLVTQANFILGTPQYMSPEQIADVGNVDTRSDIYALGALLYELLAGGPPFDPQMAHDKGAHEFRRIIREQPPKRPSTALTTRHVTSPVPGFSPDASCLPADLDWITLHALEKEPQRRYQSAAEFAADLQRFLNDEPVSAHPPSTAYMASRWIRRHRVAFAAACVSVLSLLIGAGVAVWQAKIAHEARKFAEAESIRSKEAASFLTGMLAEVAEEVKKGRNPEALRLALISSQKRIEAMSRDPDLQITLITQVAGLFDDMSDRRLATDALRRRAELIAARHGPDSAEARAAEFLHLHMVIDHGSRIEGTKLLVALRQRIERHEGRESANWFEAQRLLVRVWIKLRRGEEALTVSTEAAAEARRQKLDAPRLCTVLLYHAEALEAARRFDDATALVEECRALDDNPTQSDEIDLKLVQIQISRGDHARAADMQAAVVRRMREPMEPEHPRLPVQLLWLGEIELRARRHQAAIDHAREALALLRKRSATVADDGTHADSLREDIVKSLGLQVSGHSALKQHEQAVAMAQEALRVARQGGNQTLITRAQEALARAHESAGQLDDAWEWHRQNYELHAAHNASYQNRLGDLREMSRIRTRQKRPVEALEHASEAWRQTVAEASSQLDPDYLAYMAELAIKAWKALHAANPNAPAPAELAAWEKAVRNDP